MGRLSSGVKHTLLALFLGFGMMLTAFATPNIITYDLRPGTSIQKLASDLHTLGVTPSAWWLSLRLRLRAEPIQAGEYELSYSDSTSTLVEKFTRGQVKKYYFTLVEGWRFEQVQQALSAEPALVKKLNSPAQIATFLQLPLHHPEGWFYPDTYQYTKGMSDEVLYRQAYRRMVQKLDDIWVHRDPHLTLKNPYELLILASIIEKETAVVSEMPKISGVFYRRLQKGMRLQTDPTVVYGLGAHYTGTLRRRDLQQDTPYNTYTRAGLPPTPIAMPSEAALMAAAHPEDGDTYYFVAKGDGSHHFSVTLPEHQSATRYYASTLIRK